MATTAGLASPWLGCCSSPARPAPGSLRSRRRSWRGGDALVFDAGSSKQSASALVGQSLVEASDLQPAYGAPWLRILAMVARNGRTAVHFRTLTPAEAPGLRRQLGQVPVSLGWCRLDCDDATLVPVPWPAPPGPILAPLHPR